MENNKDKKTDDILEKLVHINRITKVVKGGRRFGFSALVVVGNQSGKIGIAHAKAKQVPDAIKKANEMARRKLIQIPLREGRTIHHDIYGKDGAGKIKLKKLLQKIDLDYVYLDLQKIFPPKLLMILKIQLCYQRLLLKKILSQVLK